MTLYEDLEKLRAMPGKDAERAAAELSFAERYNRVFDCGCTAELREQTRRLASLDRIGPEDVRRAETALAPLGEKIKGLTVLAVAHAHIDMNWMWRYDETVAVTLATFRTVLNLMQEYPGFTFSQSQASVYRIVEKYDSAMLREIQERVAQGRWEPAVSAWVEPDKNMPSGESLCRHILYAKQYMERLFAIDPDALSLDFEPDTFGHNANVPLILSNGGVKYYYHCRGYEGHHIYRWRSGAHEVLAYREPVWYNSAITFDDFLYMPQFARDNGITTLLKVYGVGDHGGGPTRRDLNRLIEMMQWPLMPAIRFGTYREFFRHLDERREQFPVVEGELNAFAAGCFTTQTRIKRMNKLCERQLYEAELYHATRYMYGRPRTDGTPFADAWEPVLFNHFHDILPGSCVQDTREYAMGNYQACLAQTGASKMMDLRELASMIDTRQYAFAADDASISEGAGAGFACGQGRFVDAERGAAGKNRLYHLFNSASLPCETPSVITVWDYPGDLSKAKLTVLGKPVAYQLLDTTPVFYWSHTCQRIAVDARVPALGYTTVAVQPGEAEEPPFVFPQEPRLDCDDSFVLENGLLRAELDAQDCSLTRLTDKRTGRDVINGKAGFFRLLTEDASKEMTAWRIGRCQAASDLLGPVTVRPGGFVRGKLLQSLTCEIPFRASRLHVTISLEHNSPLLKYACTCDFREQPVPHVSVPRLTVCFPCTVQDGSYTADIPFGHVTRPCRPMDLPAQNGVLVDTGAGKLFVLSNSKYGFCVTNEGITLSLIRGSYDPDPLPDFGPCEFDFAVGAAQTVGEMEDAALLYRHACSEISAAPGAGVLPEQGSLFEVTGARVGAVKLSEDGAACLFRLYDCRGDVRIALPFRVARAALCDLTERHQTPVAHTENTVHFTSREPLVTVRAEKE